MASTFNLNIVTPDKDFFSGDVDMIIVRTVEGDMGILRNHEPVVAPLAIGSLKIKKTGGSFEEAACSGGFINITEDEVTIITDAAEWAQEIDVDRAKTSAERAKKHLESAGEHVDILRAKASMARAMNRINIVENKYHHER
ncbi:MAG: F0F1 ATP synthase subunit epsilon [Clostridia bacterium]|nr:F0F1 ATP synthase subunit epsilon [Clostridia bacterium]